jgi:hypothetical protein
LGFGFTVDSEEPKSLPRPFFLRMRKRLDEGEYAAEQYVDKVFEEDFLGAETQLFRCESRFLQEPT